MEGEASSLQGMCMGGIPGMVSPHPLQVAGPAGFGCKWEELSSWKVNGPSSGPSLPI